MAAPVAATRSTAHVEQGQAARATMLARIVQYVRSSNPSVSFSVSDYVNVGLRGYDHLKGALAFHVETYGRWDLAVPLVQEIKFVVFSGVTRYGMLRLMFGHLKRLLGFKLSSHQVK
jgi:hypothetical protein